MHILYLDDSGSLGNAADRHIILAGLSVFERSPYWLSGELDKLAAKLWPDSPNSLEFHGTEIFSGRKQWRGIRRDLRIGAYSQALRVLSASTDVRLFGAVIHKAALSPKDPLEFAFEQICARFDQFLGRLHKTGDTQRGIIVLDESSHETTLQGLAIDFRHHGHRWGNLHNIAEVPFFVDSRATRMIQFADLVAYALRRYYENGDSTYFDVISGKFDREGGVIHGLTHYIPRGESCSCLACRQKPSQ